jgi:hypothetical protein
MQATGSVPPVRGGAGPLGSWVEFHQEPCRSGRTYQILVNHRTHVAVDLTAAEAGICQQLGTGGRADTTDPAISAFLSELREEGFLAATPPPANPGRRLTASLAALDVHWSGADRLVRAAHDRGARHLFHPAAVAAQVMLALAGLAALIAAIRSAQGFQLPVHPAQIPLVIGLSLAAITIHEFAHALVVVHHRRPIDAAGVRLHLGVPAFYIEATAALVLTRRQRLTQAAAGAWAEWQFTAAAAIWLWLAPVPAAPILHRFVILNTLTIATNLAPFVGLDGHWLLADAIRMPDLARRARGSAGRLVTALADGEHVPAGDWLLAGYTALNSIVAVALLAGAGFLWYQLFGGLTRGLIHDGPPGWLVLAAAAAILARPTTSAVAPRLTAAARGGRALYQAITFRLQWQWRIPATRHLAATIPQLAGLSDHQLGVLAGHLRRTRPRRSNLDHLTGYGIVQAGAVTATSAAHTPMTLTAGDIWDPHHQLHRAITRGTVLISIHPAAIEQLLCGADCDLSACS